MVFALLLGTVAEARAGSAPSAHSRLSIDIPAARLADALSLLSQQTGISVGIGGRLPDVMVKAVKGSMRPSVALDHLLRGTGLRAAAMGTMSFRLEAIQRPEPPHEEQPPDKAPADIVVTGFKRAQPLSAVPVSISVVSLDDARTLPPLPRSSDIAASVDGLTLTNEGAGRNRQFIRGVADSPFSGTSQSTVAIQLNDARVAYDAPDPDLRLVDVDRVEILKGPQGPLYGSGALGGVYHIVTNPPQLDRFSGLAEIHGQSVAGGDAGGGGQAVANLPVVKDRLALRAVIYRDFEPGWIDNDDGRRNSNGTHLAGERIALRWRPATEWTLDILGLSQRLNQDDTQYVLRSGEALERPSLFPEPHDNDFRMVAATVSGRVAGMDFLSATSLVDQQIGGTLDATASAAAFGLSGPLRYVEDRNYTLFNQEFRLFHSSDTGFSWVAGASWVQAESQFDGQLQASATAPVTVVAIHEEITELAAFAELSFPLADTWKVTTGGRLFRSIARNERSEASQPLADREIKNGFTPSIGLSWTPSPQRILYLRFASAVRPGGLSPSTGSEEARFASDESKNIDLGWRLRSIATGLSLEGALYATFWDHIQSDYLLSNGLVATHNAGDGRIFGVENMLRWTFRRKTTIEGGFTVQSTRLVKAAAGTVIGDDTRLPVVPGVSGRIRLSQRFKIVGWDGTAAVRVNYLGSSRLSFDQGLDRKMGNYATADVSANFSRESWSIYGEISNLLNARADSFAFGNPFSIRGAPQFTPLQPRSFTIGIQRKW